MNIPLYGMYTPHGTKELFTESCIDTSMVVIDFERLTFVLLSGVSWWLEIMEGEGSKWICGWVWCRRGQPLS